MPACYKPPHLRCTETQWKVIILSRSHTVETSAALGFGVVMMKESELLRLCFFDYHRQNQVDIKVVRIFNTYGDRMHPYDGRVVSNFVVQAIKGEDITIYGDGSQTRSFCFVDDLIEAIIRMMNSEKGFTGPVNIGNPGEFTIKELAELVIELTGSKSKIVYLPLPHDDPLQRKPDITLAKAKLDWEPKVALREGLGKTIEYFKSIKLEDYEQPTNHTAHKSSQKEEAS
eukprot:NODE_1051_length_1142_cov_985.473925_g799_i0.p1 GENE.NODE_1051_length_1142_cov_985.473925_g799_i0~~NODE_1051_length_1142_cov_985.473925_g799_i0.p1  ORF type:complete len:229 (-),score=45.23 NODE_1051_length_1142_cov_985.473925_g799_i0:55-741(-)